MDRSVRDAEFTAFVAGRSARLVHFATMLCGERQQAEDLVQGALEKAYLRWPWIDDDPFGYVRRSILNRHLSWLRRGRWRERPTGEPEDTVGSSQPDHAPRIDVQLALLDALRRLTRRQRAVVVLRYVEDLSELQTAAALDIAAGTVKATSARARVKLRAALAETGFHLEKLT